MWLSLVIFAMELIAILLTLVPLLTAFSLRTGPDRRAALWIAGSLVAGYFSGGILVWCFIPRSWFLSFPKTLAAAVDAATYGHPVEHYAEGVVILLWIGCAAGAAVTGAIAAAIARYNRHACAS